MDILSTEPFKVFDSMDFVRRKDPMSFPEDESSISCRARSIGLNCDEEALVDST